MASGQAPALEAPADVRNYILERYQQRIEYYWKTSRYNKRLYKWMRYLTVFLGALVTLVASLSSADFVKNSPMVAVTFSILTPVFAATLAIIGGVSQAFQWGAAWSDMVITATRLEKERDRVAVTPLASLEPVKELAILDDMVLNETQGFFQRLFGTGGPDKLAPKP